VMRKPFSARLIAGVSKLANRFFPKRRSAKVVATLETETRRPPGSGQARPIILAVFMCAALLGAGPPPASSVRLAIPVRTEKPKPEIPPAPVARGDKGIVVSAHLDASRAGVAVLRRGGNAMDAAVATAYALHVVEPFSAGLGGGGFLLYYDAKTKKTTVVDYREFAPKKSHRDMYVVDGEVNRELSLNGILSVAVPGMVPGLADAHRRFGKKRFASLLTPAISLAEKGFLITPRFHSASVGRLDALLANKEATRVFLKNGKPYPVGERFVQKDLGRTLRAIRRKGSRIFTHGKIAQAMAKESKRLGGLLTLGDLKGYKTRFREPLVGEYRGHTIVTMPAPSSGGTHLLQMLTMLSIDRAKRGSTNASEARSEAQPNVACRAFRHEAGKNRAVEDVHMTVEIMRRAYADRAEFMGDPSFVKIPTAGLLSKDYLTRRYETIDQKKATPSNTVSAGSPNGSQGSSESSRGQTRIVQETNDTTHLTVVDKWGNVVVLTQTINYGFGSGVVVPGTGFLLNNEMDDFSAAPGVPNVFGLVGGEANSIQPLKIPLSSMSPTIVFKDGKLRLACGSPGGSTIITTVLQIIVNVIDHGMDVAHAVAAPRIHMQWRPDVVFWEPGALSTETQSSLTSLGHTVRERPAWGNATAIEVLPDGTRVGAADPRGAGGGDAE